MPHRLPLPVAFSNEHCQLKLVETVLVVVGCAIVVVVDCIGCVVVVVDCLGDVVVVVDCLGCVVVVVDCLGYVVVVVDCLGCVAIVDLVFGAGVCLKPATHRILVRLAETCVQKSVVDNLNTS